MYDIRSLLFLIIIQFINILPSLSISHPEDLPNLLAGSFTDGDRFSTGNTLPLVGLPWGFNHWSPQTKQGSRNTGSWWFKGYDHQITWIRCTHQPSPWIGDWGWFLFSPQLHMKDSAPSRNPNHFWEPRAAILKPHLMDATVAPFGIRLELAPTMHGAILRVTFPIYGNEMSGKSVCFAETNFESQGRSPESQKVFIAGRSNQVSIDRMMVSNLNLYFRAESDEATIAYDAIDMKCFKFDPNAQIVHVRIATSLISREQVMTNFKREVGFDKSFDDIASSAKTTWRKYS